MNLINPTDGDVYIFGCHMRREPRILTRAGAIIEDASFYNFLSGYKNLEVLARTRSCYNPDHILALLDQVGLKDHRELPVGGYSTGMKQRLGLAAAILHDPDLLILDEPTKGLDPGGMQEVRQFIRELADHQGKTIFLSSHLLNEVEQICDRVAIIQKGKVIREGMVSDLLAGHSELRVEATPLDQAASVLGQHWQVIRNDHFIAVSAKREDVPHIVRRLTNHNIDVYQVTSHQQTLEDYFLAVTGDDESNE
jgi:ABC-2 type transport system ATP-binding protein